VDARLNETEARLVGTRDDHELAVRRNGSVSPHEDAMLGDLGRDDVARQSGDGRAHGRLGIAVSPPVPGAALTPIDDAFGLNVLNDMREWLLIKRRIGF